MGMDIGGSEINQRDKEKLKEGSHVVELIDAREYDGEHGHGFFIDFKVISGPSQANKLGSLVVFPDNPLGVGPKMPLRKAIAREKGKLVVYVAAVLGYSADQALETITQERFDAFFGTKPSPFLGRRFTVRSVKNGNKENSYYYQAYPITEGQAPAFEGQAAPAAAPSAPKPPAAPAVSWKTVAEDTGWRVHPDAPDYYYCGQECILATDLEKRFS